MCSQLNVFVLEDDLIQQQYLKKLLLEQKSKNNWKDIVILETARPNDIIEAVKSKPNNNIYFLDIEIHNNFSSGFELAQEIREYDPFGWIVFVTTHSEFLPITFKYKLTALDFIDKSLPDQEFENRISECIEMAHKNKRRNLSEDLFIFENQQSSFQIPFYEILFFETTELTHKIRLVTKSKYSEFYSTLNEIENQDGRLFKCHKSYVVNLLNIQKVDRVKRIIYFENNEHCLVSRSKVKILLKKMTELQQKAE